MLKANPPALFGSVGGATVVLRELLGTVTGSEETTAFLLDKSLWSEKMFSILLRRFLCSSLSPASSFSPMTCPVRLLLGAGVPRSSAGDTTTILLLLLLVFPPSSSTSSPAFLDLSAFSPGLAGEGETELSSLAFLCFLIFSSSSLSGDLNTFLARGTGRLSSSSSLSSCSSSSSLLLLSSALELERLAWMARLTDLSAAVSSDLEVVAGPVWDWALAVGTDWRGVGGSGWGEKRDWFLERRDPRERSVVSRDTRWEVVWPTTPLWKRGGISMERDDPSELELSRRARLDPVTEISSEGRLDLLPAERTVEWVS